MLLLLAMKCFRKHVWLLCQIGGIIAVFLALSCGGAPASRPPKQTSPKIKPTSGPKGTVADRTRAVTLKRRGEWSLTSTRVEAVTEWVAEASRQFGIPQDLIYGIIWVESRFNTKAVSPVGARGLMQLMPKTADYLADCINWSGRVDSFDPVFNITAGTYYIARLIDSFNGDQNLALAAYNAGPTRVRRWLKQGGIPTISIEYATMVQTARTFFNVSPNTPTRQASPQEPVPVVTDAELDRLGLTILIAGLSNRQFGLDREDDANPFE